MAGDRVLTVRIAGDSKGAVGAIHATEGATAGLGKKLLKMGALFAGLNFGANMVRDFVDVGKAYTQSMNVLQVAGQATEEEMEKIGDVAKQLGADMTLPGVSAADAASAMTEIVKSGYSVQEAMDAAQGSLQLAGAANIDAAHAAGIMADAMSIFQLEGSEANDVADRLSQTTNAVSGEITDTAEAFKNAGPVWATAGFSMDELTTAIGMMAKNGIRGAEAGTTLKTMIMRLQNPTGAAATALDEMGVSMYDAQGKTRDLSDIIADYSKATKGMTQEEKDKNAAVIFGNRAVKGANLTLARGEKQYRKTAKAIEDQAGAADTAAAKNKGFGGAVDALEGQLENLYLVVWEKVAPGMEKITRKAAKVLEAFTDLIDSPGDLADSFNNFDGKALGEKVVGAIESALKKIGSMSGKLVSALNDFISDVDWVGVGIEAGRAALPLVLGLVAGILDAITRKETWVSLANNWQVVLMGVLTIAFAPAKWIGKLAQVLSKIPFVGKLLAWLLKGLNKIGGKVKKGMWKMVKKLGEGFMKGLGYTGPGMIARLVKFFTGMQGKIASWAARAASRMGKAAYQMAERFGNWLGRHGPRQVVSALSKLKSRIFGYMSGAWNWLYNAGRSILSGLVRGIWSKASDVTGAVKGVLSKARNLLPFSPAKEGPFSGRGWTTYSGASISEGLAEGIGSRLAKVKRSALSLAKAAMPDVSMGSEPFGNGSLAVAGGLGGQVRRADAIGRSNGAQPPVQVHVHVSGNLIGEKDFAQRVTPTVREELVKIGRRNGGNIFGR